MAEVSAPISTPLPTVVSSSLAPAALNELIQLQYVRGKTFAAWSNLFRMMLKGDLTAADYDGLISRIVLPQIQSVNNVFRATSDSSTASSTHRLDRFTSQWATSIQSIERRRYNDIVAYQQAVVDHLASAINPHEGSSTPSSGSKQEGAHDHHHHHHCCRGEHRAHTTACLFYDGNGTRAASVVSAMERERTEAPKKPIGSSTALEEGKGEAKEGEHHGTSSSAIAGASERAQLVAKQKAFISNLMSGLPSSATSSNYGAARDGDVSSHPLPSQFLSFGSQKAIPTCFADLALEYIVPMEWVVPVSAVGEAEPLTGRGENTLSSVNGSARASGTSTKKAVTVVEVEDSDEEPEHVEESSDVQGGASGNTNGGHASPNDDADDEDEELIIRKLASAKCKAFEAKIRAFSRGIAEAEVCLQEALDEALEELHG